MAGSMMKQSIRLSAFTRDTEGPERRAFCLSRELLGTDKKLLPRINSAIHGEPVPPPHTSRDLRPIPHEKISLSVLSACAKPRLQKPCGGQALRGGR
jgi:hypothetical protein